MFDFNCLAPGTGRGRVPGGNVYGQHNVAADPKLADPDALDFRLKNRSPCVDAGADVGGRCRGKAPDIGFYEVRQPWWAVLLR